MARRSKIVFDDQTENTLVQDFDTCFGKSLYTLYQILYVSTKRLDRSLNGPRTENGVFSVDNISIESSAGSHAAGLVSAGDSGVAGQALGGTVALVLS